MKKLSYYLKQHIPGYLFAILSMVIAVSLDLLTPQVTRHIVDDVLVGGQMGKLKYLLLAILLIGIGRCIFQYTKEFTFDKISSTIATDMRRDLFAHIQSLSANFFDKTSTGELMARVKDDIDRIWNALGYVGMLMMEVAFHVTVILFCMYSLNWKLAILPTLCMIFCAVLAILMENRLGTIYEEISEENAKLNTVAEENLAGVRTVKAFAREKFEIKKFLSHNKRYYELNMTQSRVDGGYVRLVVFIAHAVIADQGVGHDHSLRGVGRVRENFLIAHHGGVEHQLHQRVPFGAEAVTVKLGAVLQNDFSVKNPIHGFSPAFLWESFCSNWSFRVSSGIAVG